MTGIHGGKSALAVAALVACAAANAEVNLWISYYGGGGDRLTDARYVDGDHLIRHALETAMDAPHKAFTFDTAGRIFTAQGRFAEAESALREALCIKEASMGVRSRTVPETLNNLADLQYIAGDREQAEKFYRRALDIHERDPLNIEVCRGLNGLALIHASRGDRAEAEALLERALDVHHRAGRRDHPFAATAAINLAILYLNSERAAQALPLLKRAGYIHTKTLPAQHPDVALRLEVKAEVLAALGRIDDARAVRQKAEAMDGSWTRANLNTH